MKDEILDHDHVATPLLQCKHFTTTKNHVEILKIFSKAIKAVQKDGLGCLIEAKDSKTIKEFITLGTETIAFTYVLYMVVHEIPKKRNLAARKKANEVLRNDCKEKGLPSLGASLEARMKELETRLEDVEEPVAAEAVVVPTGPAPI